MSWTIERLRRRESGAGPMTTVRAWMPEVAVVVLPMFMVPSPGAAASDWVLQALLSEDAATVEVAVSEFLSPLGGSEWTPGSVDSLGVWFREDVDLASWVGEVLAKGRPEARELVGGQIIGMASLHMAATTPEMIEFAAGNHGPAKEQLEAWPGDLADWVPTMQRLRSREDGDGLLANLSETVPDDEARRLALVFAGQMRRIQAALPRLLEEEYDRRRHRGMIGSDEVLDLLLQSLAYLQEGWGTEATRAAAWAKWMKEREARGLPTRVVEIEAPWNLLGVLGTRMVRNELGESGFPLEGRRLAPGVRRVALALIDDPAMELESENSLAAATALLANERPLAEGTARRIFDLYCGALDGDCFEKLNLLYAGPDDPSLRSVESDVGRHIVESLTGLVVEKERQCGALAECSDSDCTTVVRVMSEADSLNLARRFGQGPEDLGGAWTGSGSIGTGEGTWSRAEGEVQFRLVVPVRERLRSIGEQLQEVLALVGRLDSVPRPVLDGVFEFWSTERFPEARRILEEHDWLEPDVAAVSSAQRERPGTVPPSWRRIGVAELCEGRI